MSSTAVIYVSLLNEGSPTCRPVLAAHESDDVYRIIGVNEDPDDEEWEFCTGDRVRCTLHKFGDGRTTGLLAYEKTP